MLDVQDWLGSVGGVHSTLSTGLELSRTFMEGAHHRPLAELGRGRSYWVTGDVASSSRSRDLITRSGEAGVTFEAAPDVLIGVGTCEGDRTFKAWNRQCRRTWAVHIDAPQASDTAPFYTPLSRATSELSLGCA